MHNSRFLASRATRSGLQTRRGLTLVEMLISLVCVIILMLAYTQLFSNVSTRITEARSMIDLTNRMRGVANQLRTDLAGHTCEMRPPLNPQAGAGYFEYVEGPLHDKPGENGYSSTDNFLGDTDDVLMFTTRCKNDAFTGKYNGSTTVQSQVAEVVWFLRPTLLVDPSSSGPSTTPANPATFTLYRRTYLVMPTYQGQPTTITATAASPLMLPNADFYRDNDLSVHYDLNSGKFVANTLGDLTKRECRYGHIFLNDVAATSGANGFPHPVYPLYLVPFGGNLTGGQYLIDRSNSRYGEDVVLTNVVSFDVQAWDPTAPVYNNGGVAVSPADKGFNATPNSYQSNQENPPSPPSPQLYYYPQPNSLGAFVDLNWTGSNHPWSQIIFPVGVSLFNFDPCGTYTPTNPYAVHTGRIPLVTSTNASGCVKEMSPFYSTGYPRSQLVAAGGMPTDFSTDWMNDDQPNYTRFGITPATYDTWSTHYEHDGINQVSGGTNNADAAGSGFSAQPETSPPYPAPLRGIKITLRCYEPDSRQMHEISVVESFVPE